MVFDLPESGKVGIEIYDALANRVFDIEEIYQTGRNEFIWSGITTSGKQVPSGVYIYRITSGEKVLSGKMVLLK
ncbi:MAG: T9SS type A sorting domain-containing protein [Ignavibacteriales bacterium]|nr:T9SS type A sorting domain-containing protein [Ignavibacteriales bacterium]